MAKSYKYTAKNGDTTVCEIAIHSDGHWEFETWPDNMTKEALDSFSDSCQNALGRLLKHGLTKIEFKKLT